MSGDDQDTAISDVGREVPASAAASECLVIVHQREGLTGRCIKLGRFPVRIGRDPNNEVELEDEGVSRRHARLERHGDRTVIMDVGSRNGTLLNDDELDGIVELKTGDRIKIGSTVFKYLSASDLESVLHEQIFANTITDALTDLKNKRFLNDELAREFSRARRYGRVFSILMIDIDHFKRVNDLHGHQIGDITLREVAGRVVSCLRAQDTAVRYGGEEIVVLLPETKLEDAVAAAERIRRAVANHVLSYRDITVQVTVSIGCSQFDPADVSDAELLRRADDRVYAAKEAGRNCVKA